MGTLSTSAIIVIVIVACLALVSLGAALFKTYGGPEKERPYNFSREQESYMRTVRLKNLGFFQRESMMGYPGAGGGGGGSGKGPAAPVVQDVESGYSENDSSHY
ncbi:hypothetical protein ASPACDRAFT_75519 [Aspergillus aculeatus ATCC 16872]|uniref:Uncharacterized protein n=1 Tax=Aspergillus aculeatus (strain ATCC 16872 / CBS 172.66 / WB 5094) TaxID=690307 RepID=A0A1L9X6D8_ASPA1|nr:uncharacterized protein ASPACDRAFT_75519 [Aspergillus aculeatus ATCC 16872]OJK04011.1 hypothetical protein ASPACDRAFT_75519 [Aspergillus aculeatus ATCC 16872]